MLRWPEERESGSEEKRERKRDKEIGAWAGIDREDEAEIMREIEKKRAERKERALVMQERRLEEMRLERESREKILMERMRLERDRMNTDAEERKEDREAVNLLLAFLAKKKE